MRKVIYFVMGLIICLGPAAFSAVYFEDFNSTNGGFTHSGTQDEWEYGAPSFAEGPASAYSAPSCWGVDLNGNYENDSDQVLVSLPIYLTGFTGPFEASCAIWYKTASNDDVFFWEYSTDDGVSWQPINDWSGESTSWTIESFDIPGNPAKVQFRWRLTSDNADVSAGAYVDDVTIVSASEPTATPNPPVCHIDMPPGHGSAGFPMYEAGDSFSLDITIDNPGANTYNNVPLIVVLYAYGSFFFAPTYASTLDYFTVGQLNPGTNAVAVIPEFAWPDCTGIADEVRFYAVMANADLTDFWGEMDCMPFGWDAYCDPTPTPTPSGDGYTSGRAVFYATGIAITPDEASKAVVFSLDGANCQSVWMRQRAWYGAYQYQIKLVGNEYWPKSCTAEWDPWSMKTIADGEWVMTWGVNDGRTWVRCDAPNGTSETVTANFIMTVTHPVAGPGPCAESPAIGTGTVSIISFEGYTTGYSTVCPDAR